MLKYHTIILTKLTHKLENINSKFELDKRVYMLIKSNK